MCVIWDELSLVGPIWRIQSALLGLIAQGM